MGWCNIWDINVGRTQIYPDFVDLADSSKEEGLEKISDDSTWDS